MRTSVYLTTNTNRVKNNKKSTLFHGRLIVRNIISESRSNVYFIIILVCNSNYNSYFILGNTNNTDIQFIILRMYFT